MANHTYDGSESGVLDLAGNWDVIPDGTPGVLIFDAGQNTPAGYLDGTPPATAMTIDGTWGLSLLAGANLTLAGILGDLGNQVVVDVTLVTASIYDHDATENITGDVSLNASTMEVSANAAIGGTVDLVAGTYTHTSTGAITGAVTVDTNSSYNAGANHTLTGGITVSGSGIMDLDTFTVTGDVDLEGGSLLIGASGDIVGAVIGSAAGCSIDLDAAGTITGSVDMAANDCAWPGTGELTVDVTSDLVLGGPAVGLDIDIDAAAQTITVGAVVNIDSLTVTACTEYTAGAYAHTFASGVTQAGGTITATGTWTLTGTGPLTITDALVTLDIIVNAPAATITVGAPLSVEGLTITDCTTYAAGAHAHISATDFILTAGAVTATGEWKMTGTGNLAMVCTTMPLKIDTGGEITATGPVSVKTLTLTTGTLTLGAQPITVAGTVLQSAGEITSTGLWTMTANATVTITDAMTGAYFNITGGTTTLANALSIAGLQIQAGATFDADSNSLALAVGRITGYGILTNLTPAGVIHVAPGVIDGGGNDSNVVFDTVAMPIIV